MLLRLSLSFQNFFPEQMVAWCQDSNGSIPQSQLLQVRQQHRWNASEAGTLLTVRFNNIKFDTSDLLKLSKGQRAAFYK